MVIQHHRDKDLLRLADQLWSKVSDFKMVTPFPIVIQGVDLGGKGTVRVYGYMQVPERDSLNSCQIFFNEFIYHDYVVKLLNDQDLLDVWTRILVHSMLDHEISEGIVFKDRGRPFDPHCLRVEPIVTNPYRYKEIAAHIVQYETDKLLMSHSSGVPVSKTSIQELRDRIICTIQEQLQVHEGRHAVYYRRVSRLREPMVITGSTVNDTTKISIFINGEEVNT